jgi:hypothetical protein
MIPVALSFVATAIGMAAFVQYCSMSRLRMGGWTGVALAVALYGMLAVGGGLTGSSHSIISLLNSLVYLDAVTEHDRSLHRVSMEMRWANRQELSVTNGEGVQETDSEVVLFKGLIGEILLSLMLGGLTFVIWYRIRDEMIAEAEG